MRLIKVSNLFIGSRVEKGSDSNASDSNASEI